LLFEVCPAARIRPTRTTEKIVTGRKIIVFIHVDFKVEESLLQRVRLI
jgi:hypothetical protein